MTTCARIWQAEAVVDGRLAQEDAESFQRHAATCRSCTRELQLLEQLSEAGEALPWPESTPLSRRRQRNELLRKANELTLEAARRGPPGLHAWRGRLAAVALVACGLAALWWWPRAGEQTRRAHDDGAPTFQLQSSEGAVWRTLERGPRLRVALERGRFELTVDALRPGQRFLVALPDGELEVRGTRFKLDIADARTRRVEVQEGRVALQLEHGTLRVLSAGDSWTNWALPPVQTLMPSSSSGSDAGASPLATPVAPRAASRQRKSNAGAIFARGMEAFKRADFAEVEAVFSAFEREHPRDARVEDALFLRTFAAARRGDSLATRTLARSYLARYPNGLRRSEVERLAR